MLPVFSWLNAIPVPSGDSKKGLQVLLFLFIFCFISAATSVARDFSKLIFQNPVVISLYHFSLSVLLLIFYWNS